MSSTACLLYGILSDFNSNAMILLFLYLIYNKFKKMCDVSARTKLRATR